MTNATISFKTTGDEYTSGFYSVAENSISTIDMILAGQGGETAHEFDVIQLRALRKTLVETSEVQQFFLHNTAQITLPLESAYLMMRLRQNYDWMDVSRFVYKRAEEEAKQAKEAKQV